MSTSTAYRQPSLPPYFILILNWIQVESIAHKIKNICTKVPTPENSTANAPSNQRIKAKNVTVMLLRNKEEKVPKGKKIYPVESKS